MASLAIDFLGKGVEKGHFRATGVFERLGNLGISTVAEYALIVHGPHRARKVRLIVPRAHIPIAAFFRIPTQWQDLERVAERLEWEPNGTAQARAFRRLHFAQCESLVVNGDGQVYLPEHLTQVASLKKEGVLIGVGDHVELWDAQRWQQYLKEHLPAKPIVIQEEEESYQKAVPASAPFNF